MVKKEALPVTEEPTEETPDEKTLDEKEPVVEEIVVKEPVAEEQQPLTADQFSSALTTLTGRAKTAGLRPLRIMATAYIQQGLSMIDGLLGAFDESDEKKKKKDQ
jgi:hypothetical protein